MFETQESNGKQSPEVKNMSIVPSAIDREMNEGEGLLVKLHKSESKYMPNKGEQTKPENKAQTERKSVK